MPSLRRIATTARAQVQPRGLAVPVRANVAGQLALAEGTAQSRAILRRALSDCSNENGFRQGVGIRPVAVLRAINRTTLAIARAEVERALVAVADRIETIAVETRAEADRIVADVTYRDRITGDADRVSLPLRSP